MISGYNFTDGVRRVLQAAREEANRLHHPDVGTEHQLLGVLRVEDEVTSKVLTNLHFDPGDLRDRVTARLKPGPPGAVGDDLPYTSRAKKVLELAMTEARELRHSYVGTEHLLLGLLRESKGIAAEVLVAAGAQLASLRAETLRVLGPEVAPQVRSARSPAQSTSSVAVVALIVALVALIVGLAALVR